MWEGTTAVDKDQKAGLHEAVSYLDIFLEGSPWVAGGNMTIADFVCVANVSSLVVSSYSCYLGIVYGREEKQLQKPEENCMMTMICTHL